MSGAETIANVATDASCCCGAPIQESVLPRLDVTTTLQRKGVPQILESGCRRHKRLLSRVGVSGAETIANVATDVSCCCGAPIQESVLPGLDVTTTLQRKGVAQILESGCRRHKRPLSRVGVSGAETIANVATDASCCCGAPIQESVLPRWMSP